MVQQIATSSHDLRHALRHAISAKLEPGDGIGVSTVQEAEPVGIREFITDEEYCGDTKFWELPLRELERILQPGCKGAVIEKGIRGSKSYSVCYIPVYLMYRHMFEEIVLCKDPRERYELAHDTVIYNAIFTINGKLANKLFYYISSFVTRCQWFKRPDVAAKLRRNPHVTTEIQFCPWSEEEQAWKWKEPRYAIYPGTSKLTSAAGVALFTYIMDECNLFQVAESSGSSGKDYAEELDEECDQRVTSSFGEDGQRIYISRRNVINDFTARKKAKWAALPDGTERYYLPLPKTSWADWPERRRQKERWRLFSPAKCDWVKDEPERRWEEIQDDPGFWVPQRFWDNFSADPESALKVLGSIPGEAQEPFFRLAHKIAPDFGLVQCVLPTTKPEDWMDGTYCFDELVRDNWYGDHEEIYYWHCDQSLSRDYTGLVITRSSGVDSLAVESEENRPEYCGIVDVEGLILIKAPKGGEIVYQRIREILIWLSDYRGFRLGMGSFDAYNSKDSMQILNGRGIPCKHLSMDKDKEGLGNWITCKDAVYEERVFFPPAHGQTEQTSYQELLTMAKKGDPSARLQVELRQLEIVNGKRIDHPPHGSKDMADAFCGATIHALRYRRPGGDN